MKNFKIFYRQIQEEIKNADEVRRYIDTVDEDNTAHYFYIKDKENDSDVIKIGVNVSKDSMKDMNEDQLKSIINTDLKKAVRDFEKIGMRNKMSDCAMEVLDYFKKNADKITEDNITEKWTDKYKKSIDCNNPKGFSQRAHCQGRKKKSD